MNKKKTLLVLFFVLFFVLDVYAKQSTYSKMAEELSTASNFLKNPKVAIIPFSYLDKRPSNGGLIVSERLTTRIVRLGKLQVIERQLLEKVLQELKLETTGIVDVKTTKQLGKILGVDAIIAGTLLDIKKNKVEVNARVINTRESSPWPIKVEPIVLAHNHRPLVAIFIFARTKELENSPIRYAINDAASIRGVYPRIRS